MNDYEAEGMKHSETWNDKSIITQNLAIQLQQYLLELHFPWKYIQTYI